MSDIHPSLEVNVAGIQMKNPVMTASGTFGYGSEYADFIDLNQIGAVVVKRDYQCAVVGKFYAANF